MKYLRFLIISVLIISIGTVVHADYRYIEEKSTPISKVEISDIEYPYENGTQLDTTAKVSSASHSYLSKVSWDKNSGLYRVTVTVRPEFDYYYTNQTKATVNGSIASTFVNEENFLEISYTFPEDKTIEKSESLNSLKHAITVLSSSRGVISPSMIRAPHGKDYTVQIIPNEGYEIKDVFVDGRSVGAVSEYTFKNVTKPHKISATYQVIKGYTPAEKQEEMPLKEVLTSVVTGFLRLLGTI